MNEIRDALKESQQFEELRTTLGDAFNSLVTLGDAVKIGRAHV